ncbi:MAG: tetratricopeptide repeat protein [Pseudomonadota bacterium]
MNTKIAFAFVLFTALATLAGPSTAQAPSKLEQGWAAYARGDYAKAIKLIQPSAEAGDPESQFMIGRIHQYGQGVPKDYAEAVKWYKPSAEAGLSYAQNNLGVMYKNGWGVKQDNVKAHLWFSLAIESYLDFEQMNVERARQNKLSVSEKMTPAEISEAQDLAEAFVPKPSPFGASTLLLAR